MDDLSILIWDAGKKHYMNKLKYFSGKQKTTWNVIKDIKTPDVKKLSIVELIKNEYMCNDALVMANYSNVYLVNVERSLGAQFSHTMLHHPISLILFFELH